MHEQSETIQRPDGRWINVYGQRTPRAGQPLDALDYGTVGDAVSAAVARSASHVPPPPPGFALDAVPPPPPGFALDAAPSFANTQGGASTTPQNPVEPTFAERYVAPTLEWIGGAIKAATPYMDPRISKAVELASNPAPIVQGMADAPVGLAQMVFNAIGWGDKVNPAIHAQEAQYQQSRGSEADTFDPARVISSIANPLPIKAAGLVKPAATVAKRAAQGAGFGAAAGASQPVYENDFWGHKGAQAGGGAALGASIPAVAEIIKQVARGGYHLIEPRLRGGIDMIVGRTANKAAGERQPDVVKALEEAKAFVPGSRPTSGEAAVPAGSAEFAGLQKVTEGRLPSEYLARDAEQAGARRASIREVGKDSAALDAAKTERSAEANRNYGSAYAKEIKADPKLAKLSSDPFFKRAVPMAMDLAKSGGVDPKKDLTKFLHFVKLSIDDRLGKTGSDALGNVEKNAVQGVKQRLVSWLEKKNPDYGKAREAFAEASTPINQMQVGQFLEKKLEAPLVTEGGAATKAQRASEFAGAVREAPRTIKSATTGSPRYQELEDVLTPEQSAKVSGIVKDMARSADYEEMGRRGTEAARRLVGENLDPKQLPNALHRPIMVINAVLKRVQGSAEGASLDAMAKKMLDPAEMARVMKLANQQEREGILASLFGAVEASANPIAAVEGAAVGKAASGEVPDAPRDKTKREVGRVYRTPQGPKEWSENGWLTIKK